MKIVVLAGGISTERDVSLASGRMIYEALKRSGHQAMLLDVYLGYDKPDYESVFEQEQDWAKEIGGVGEKNPDMEAIKALRRDADKSFFGPRVMEICQAADIVFMALHGENGENGKLQAAFDLMGIRYTGTDYVSSALAMDKGLSKELFLQNGIATPKSCCVSLAEAAQSQVAFPSVIKVCCGGSSVGVYIVHNDTEYKQALQEAAKYDTQILIEQYIKGREFSVGVIDGRALPVIEIAPLNGFYDYKNKYQAGSTVETCPADLPEDIAAAMRAEAEKVFRVLRLKAYARMDFMMDESGSFYCLEANTLPGMTPTSLLPQEALAEGMSFEALCEKLIEVSLNK